MAKKTPQPNMDVGTLSKNRSWRDFLEVNSLLNNPTNPKWRAMFRETLLQWADSEEALEIQQFLQMYRIPRTTYTEWINAYPDITNTHAEVMLIIASRKRLGCLKKIYDRETAFKDMHRYDPSWGKEVNEYWSMLKEREAAAGGVQVVEIPVQASTGKIKPKKEKKETNDTKD